MPNFVKIETVKRAQLRGFYDGHSELSGKGRAGRDRPGKDPHTAPKGSGKGKEGRCSLTNPLEEEVMYIWALGSSGDRED